MDHRDPLFPPANQKLGFQGISLLPGGIDPDAQLYFDAAGITDATEIAAANSAIKSLKASGTWDKLVRLYLISPTSLTAARRCAKSLVQATASSTSYSSNGIIVQAGGNFYDTSSIFNFSTWPDADFHISTYFQYAAQASDWNLMGWRTFGSATDEFDLYVGYNNSSGKMEARYGIRGADANLWCVDPGTPSSGCYVFNVDSTTTASLYKDGSEVATDTAAANPLSATFTAFWQLGKAISPTGGSWGSSSNVVKSSTIGYRLTADQKTSLNTALTAYNTALGRP